MLSHKKLLVWKKSVDLVKLVYECTNTFPKSELFGLVSQMRRAAVSIPSNIAEGSLRDSNKDFIRFLLISLGSCSELETQIHIAKNIGFMKNEKEVLEKTNEIIRMLSVLIKKRKAF